MKTVQRVDYRRNPSFDRKGQGLEIQEYGLAADKTVVCCGVHWVPALTARYLWKLCSNWRRWRRWYHYDEMCGESRLDKRLPVEIKTDDTLREGVCRLIEWDFHSGSGAAYLSDDGKTAHLHIHSNASYDFQMADGSSFSGNGNTPKAQRPENARMQAFLAANGIDATPKYIPDGSLKRTWRLYNRNIAWSQELADKLNALGFSNWEGRPLDRLDGNGGMFSVFVRGHDELLTQ